MTIEASSKESPIMKFGGIASSGMEPGICRLWDIARGGMAMQSWLGRSSGSCLETGRPGNDLDDVNAAFLTHIP